MHVYEETCDVGSLFEGRYTVLGRLGSGGIADVYLVHDGAIDRMSALKILAPHHARRPSLIARFVAEARMMQRLRHPNLLRAYAAGVRRGLPYFLMEYAAGGSLGLWLYRNGPMPPAMAVGVGIEICSAALAAHQAGILHRDIKPDNVLITADGRIVLGDFGLARADVPGTTRTGTSMGTLGYVAPEQLDDASRVDEATDIYSIGATLYATVTAQAPPNDLYLRDPWDHCFDGIPQPLIAVIGEATRRSRAKRFPAAAALQHALRRILSHLPRTPADTPALTELAIHRGYTCSSVQSAPDFYANAQTLAPVSAPSSGSGGAVLAPLSSNRSPSCSARSSVPSKGSSRSKRAWISLFRG